MSTTTTNNNIDTNVNNNSNIAVIGCGYVGLITGTVLAQQNHSRNFVFLDIDKDKIDNLKKCKHYIKEPLFAGYFDTLRNISLSTNYKDIKNANIIMIAIGAYRNDLTNLYSSIQHINEYAQTNAIVILLTTIEVGLTKSLSRTRFRYDLNVFHIPEFLTNGEAIASLMKPRRIVIGYTNYNTEAINQLRNIYSYVSFDKIIITDSNTSEISKLSANTMLAQRISTINAIETLCKEQNANINDVSKILRLDERIGTTYLFPSAGYGGKYFRNDVKNLSTISHDMWIKRYFDGINQINEYHMIKIADEIGNNKNVLFLGYCYKELTNDIHNSPTQFIIDYLSSSTKYTIYDKHIPKYSTLPQEHNFDIVVLINNEQEYVDLVNEYRITAKIIDPRHILDV